MQLIKTKQCNYNPTVFIIQASKEIKPLRLSFISPSKQKYFQNIMTCYKKSPFTYHFPLRNQFYAKMVHYQITEGLGIYLMLSFLVYSKKPRLKTKSFIMLKIFFRDFFKSLVYKKNSPLTFNRKEPARVVVTASEMIKMLLSFLFCGH